MFNDIQLHNEIHRVYVWANKSITYPKFNLNIRLFKIKGYVGKGKIENKIKKVSINRLKAAGYLVEDCSV